MILSFIIWGIIVNICYIVYIYIIIIYYNITYYTLCHLYLEYTLESSIYYIAKIESKIYIFYIRKYMLQNNNLVKKMCIYDNKI